MAPPEKCIQNLPSVRVSEPLRIALLELAAKHDRTFSDYIRQVLELHVFGHGATLQRRSEDGN